MLLPYILTKGALTDDDTGIAESGNGIPDIIDEARYEGGLTGCVCATATGYGSGVTNPNTNNELFQAGPAAMSAWANAANAAMLADAFRIAGIYHPVRVSTRRLRWKPGALPTPMPTPCSIRRSPPQEEGATSR